MDRLYRQELLGHVYVRPHLQTGVNLGGNGGVCRHILCAFQPVSTWQQEFLKSSPPRQLFCRSFPSLLSLSAHTTGGTKVGLHLAHAKPHISPL